MQNQCRICEKLFEAKTGGSTQCPSCGVSKRRWKMKLKLVALLGGKCERCGFDQHPAALHFHHKDSKTKLFNISANSLLKSFSDLKNEVMKCELLCANCHGIEHSNMEKYDRLMDEIRTKSGMKTIYTCECGSVVSESGRMCSECSHKLQRRVEWPTKEELEVLISKYSFLAIGKMFSVSDNSIRKWCKHYQIPLSGNAPE